MEKNLYILVHPDLSLGTIKREVDFITDMGHDIALVNHGENNAPLDAYMLSRAGNVVSSHIVAKGNVQIANKGRGVIVHGSVERSNLKTYIMDFLRGHHGGYGELLYMHDVEPDMRQNLHAVKDEIVEDEIVEDEIVEDEIVEDEIVEDEVIEHEHEDGTVHSHEGGDEEHDHSEDNLDEDTEEDSSSDGSDSDDRPNNWMWNN